MPVNMLLEAKKWQMLVQYSQPLTFKEAFASYLAGLAFSVITPNRVGEYPGRLIYLKKENTLRLVNVSILGAIAQMLTVMLFGIIGLIYYNITIPSVTAKVVLASTVGATFLIVIIYTHFEKWLPKIEHIKWLKKYIVYAKLLRAFKIKEQLAILSISVFRFVVYSCQFMCLFYWLNIQLPILSGFCTTSLFFFSIAILPSIAIAELGLRGQLSIFLFHPFTIDTIGILVATFGLWFINLVVPALAGTILILRMRWTSKKS